MNPSRLLLVLSLAVASACSDASPSATFERFSQASQKGEWETVYGLLDTAARVRLDSLVQVFFASGALAPSTAASLGDAPPVDRFAAIADDLPELYRHFDFAGYAVVDENTSGDRAILTIQLQRGPEQEVKLVRMRKENGKWRVGI